MRPARRTSILALASAAVASVLAVPLPAAAATAVNEDFEDGAADGFTVVTGTYSVISDGSKDYRTTSSAARSVAGDPASTDVAAPSTGSAYDTAVLADSPAAYWRLGDSGTVVADATGHGHTGTYTGAPTATTLPNGDPATKFNGSTQYATIADGDYLSIPGTGQITVEAWLRPDVLQFSHQESTGYVHWMGKGTTGQHEYAARMYSLTNSESRPNRISGYSFNLGGGLGAGSYFQDPVTAGQWIHYTLVINTTNVSGTYPTGYTKIYKNGVLRDQDSLQDYAIVPGNGTAPFRIATRDFASYFEGAIGKVAVYNYELSSTRIAAHYAAM